MPLSLCCFFQFVVSLRDALNQFTYWRVGAALFGLNDGISLGRRADLWGDLTSTWVVSCPVFSQTGGQEPSAYWGRLLQSSNPGTLQEGLWQGVALKLALGERLWQDPGSTVLLTVMTLEHPKKQVRAGTLEPESPGFEFDSATWTATMWSHLGRPGDVGHSGVKGLSINWLFYLEVSEH